MPSTRMLRDAREGNVYAMLALGYKFQMGKGDDMNPQLAAKWYESAFEKGCGRAAWELFRMYRDGELADDAERTNFKMWLQSAADSGIPEACRILSSRYFYGNVYPKDDAEAMRWLKYAANAGDPLSVFRLACSYMIGINGERRPETSARLFSLFERIADADLLFRAGRDFEFGLEGVPEDMGHAAHFYGKGAEMGHDRCIVSLTRLNATLNGAPRDTIIERRRVLQQTPTAVELRMRDQLMSEADRLAEEGRGDEAVERYQESADLGNADACFMLAMLYHDGELVRRNDRVALDYLIRASQDGSTDAGLFLGRNYASGRGVNKNVDEAVRQFGMSAAGGNLVSLYELGKLVPDPERYVRDNYRVVR